MMKIFSLCRTELRGLVRHRRLRLVLLQGDRRRVHQLRQKRILESGPSVQKRHRRKEHPVAELGDLPEGPTELLDPRRVPFLFQRDT